MVNFGWFSISVGKIVLGEKNVWEEKD